jgi:hypothetical protein
VVTISVNDKVQWTWQSSFHNSVSTNTAPLWTSPVQNAGATYTNTFNSPGGFGYRCTIHNFPGTVIVQAPNTPPLVTVTNPADGVILSAPATFTLGAAASDPGGSVASVQFFQGASSLGSDASSPYSMNVNNLAAGDYTLSAVALDSGGLTTTNAITIHVVDPVPMVLSGAQSLSATSFQFNYSANVGLKYVVQRSTNLFYWTSLSTNPAGSTSVPFMDSAAPGSAGYYRVGRLPNP